LPTDADNSDPSVPRQFGLGQNYPNPFNPTTTITFTLPTRSIVTLEIFNLLGESVSVLVSGKLDAGPHQISWNGTDRAGRPVASGVYFYKLTSAGHSAARKMLLLK
jgi:flagellar hook assembly protein FlgD